MDIKDLLIDAFGRVREDLHHAVDGLNEQQLTFRPDDQANSIAWLAWHLTRIQDDHVAAVSGREQTWTAQGWVDRLGLPFDPAATGYGHRPAEVAAVNVDSALLKGYYDAVHDATITYIGSLQESDLDRIVDERWDPPVTLGVRLVSVVSDDLQHVGQAAFLRGIVERS